MYSSFFLKNILRDMRYQSSDFMIRNGKNWHNQFLEEANFSYSPYSQVWLEPWSFGYTEWMLDAIQGF